MVDHDDDKAYLSLSMTCQQFCTNSICLVHYGALLMLFQETFSFVLVSRNREIYMKSLMLLHNIFKF